MADGDAGLRVIEFYGTGIEERIQPTANGSRQTATIVRIVLKLNTEGRARNTVSGPRSPVLLDICGRKVLDLKTGDNDIRHLAPGVYFVITSSPFSSPPEGERNKERGRWASSVYKVIITE